MLRRRSIPRAAARLLPLLLLLTLAGCDLLGSDDDGAAPARGILVANQGNFTAGDGSVTAYDPGTGQAADVLGADGQLGTIVQSLLATDDRVYVLGNTGDRIDVLDAATYARVGQIAGVPSPRYMAVVGDTGYVTGLYAGVVTVVDLNANAVVGDVAVGANPEDVAVVGTRLFVANHGFGAGTTVDVVDTAARRVVQRIDVDCDGPRFLEADRDGDVWVFCTGQTLYDAEFNVVGETDGAVRVLDAATGAVAARLAVDGRLGTQGPGQDAWLAPEADEVFVIKDQREVLRFDTRTNAARGGFAVAGDPVGAVAYDAGAERLYLGRVPGFTDAGYVTVHDRDGSQTARFPAGVAPAYIVVQE